MKRIRVMNVSIEFDANQMTVGDDITQAKAAMEQINNELREHSMGLKAEIVSIEETREDDIELVPGIEHATQKMRTVEMAINFSDGTWNPNYFAKIPIDTPNNEIEEAGRKFILNEYKIDHDIVGSWLYNSMDDEGNSE